MNLFTPLGARRWLPVLAVLFVAYQLPEGLRRLGMHTAVSSAVMLAFLLVAWLAARSIDRDMGQAYALEWNRPAAVALATGLAIALAAKATALIAGHELGIYLPQAQLPDARPSLEILATLAWLALGTFVPSIAEDILTRGFWARVPNWRWTGPGFIVATSTLYLLNHIYRLGNGAGEWLMLLCFGLAYGAACWRAGSLWAAVGLHWGWNFAGQALDLGWPSGIHDPAGARVLSGAMHLAILALVPLAFRRGQLQPDACHDRQRGNGAAVPGGKRECR